MVDDLQLDIESLRKMVKDNPDDSEAWCLLGIAFLDKAQWKKAIHALEKATESSDSVLSHVALADAYVETKRYKEAETTLRKALSSHYDNAVVLKDLGFVLYVRDQLQEAEDALRSSLVYDELDAWVHCLLGDILTETGRGAEAVAFYNRATMLDGQDFDAWVGIGKHFIGRRKYAEAEKPFEMAVQLKNDDVPSLVSLGTVQYELGKYGKAEQTVRRVLAQEPTNAKSLVVLGKTLYMLKRPDEAEKVFKKAKRAWRKLESFYSSKAWTDLGSFYKEIGSYDRAQKTLKRAIAINPESDLPHCAMESLYQKMGRVEDAYKERMIIALLTGEHEFIPDIPYDDIDDSIREVIRQFNDLGLLTIGSCSGLDEDHVGRKSEFGPFLIIEVNRPNLHHHLITIADMAGWKSEYTATEIDFSLKDYSQEEIGKRWDLLLSSAEIVMKRIARGSHIEE
jgi:tetratricopeptide (TPR) repeat protein